MSEPDLETALASRVRTLRILLLSQCALVLMFLGLAAYLQSTVPIQSRIAPLTLNDIAFAAVAVVLPAQFVASLLLAKAGRTTIRLAGRTLARLSEATTRGRVERLPLLPDELAQFYQVYKTRLILSAALLETGAFITSGVYLLGGKWLPLALTGVLLLALASKLPTIDGLQRWLERQQELIEAERNG